MTKAEELLQAAADAVHLLMKAPGADVYAVATLASLNFHQNPTPLAEAIMHRADELAGSLAECLAIQEEYAREEAEERAWRMRY